MRPFPKGWIPTNLMIVAIVVLFVNLSYSQNKKNYRLSAKAGFELSSFDNRKPYTLNEVFANWKLSFSYLISDKTSLELEYIYMPDYSYIHSSYYNSITNDTGYVIQADEYNNYDKIYSNVFNVRVNYSFLSLIKS
jgi:hypothetical protein